ncbi:MAG: RNA-guided endonuclease InsQ/TnpB family protein [Ktedonobacterales bacterium]
MLVLDYKLRVTPSQQRAIDEAIRTVQFVRNKCVRTWMDGHATRNDLQILCTELAHTYSFVAPLNSQARQASADRAWQAIARFYDNCRSKKPGKKGYPQFQHDNRSVEYKQTGWKLAADGKQLTVTDGSGIGTLRLIGTRDLATFPIQQIRRVRLVRRADGYYAQFAVQVERQVAHIPTGLPVGIDLGLASFLTDSEGTCVDNPRFLRKAEKKLKRLHRHLSRTQKRSRNRTKARQQLAKEYLTVSQQREDFARKQASTLITSHDLIAYEALQIPNMVKNHHLAKSISDAAWGRFLAWVRYYGRLQGVPVIAVAPQFTSQDCSGCGQRVEKSLSIRTHRCPSCGLVLDRDENAARNILQQALSGTAGQAGTGTPACVPHASGQGTTTA